MNGFPRMIRTCQAALAVPTGLEVWCKIAGLQAALSTGASPLQLLEERDSGQVKGDCSPTCPGPALGTSAQGWHLQVLQPHLPWMW